MFQSTHPHGVRHGADDDVRFGIRFNPRTHTGCDWERKRVCFLEDLFQSTHPHGVRPFFCKKKKIHRGFNPRTHTGCDWTLKDTWDTMRSFNPRTHTGCDDPVEILYVQGGERFQSTHPHGVRPMGEAKDSASFQSTHPHGVRLIRTSLSRGY